MRLSTVCPLIPMSTGATTTSEMGESEYIGGVAKDVGEIDGEVEHEEESEGESEGESIDPRERLSAGRGRAMRMSSHPLCSGFPGGGIICGCRPNSERRVDARTSGLVLPWPRPTLAVLES